MSRKTLIRIITSTLLLTGALAVAKVHAVLIGGYDLTATNSIWWVLAFGLIASIFGYLLGLPEDPSLSSPLVSATFASLAATLSIALFQTVLGQFVLPRFFLLVTFPLNIAIFVLCHILNESLNDTLKLRDRIFLIGSKDEISLLHRDTKVHHERPFVVVYEYEVDTLNSPDYLIRKIQEAEPSIVVYGKETTDNPLVVNVLTSIHMTGKRLRKLEDFYESHIGKVSLPQVTSRSMLFDIHEVHHPIYRRVARVIDLTVGIIGLIVLLALIPIAYCINRFANKGPLFYTQDRIGKNGRVFRIIKLRTMSLSAELTSWTKKDDPRITTFGRFLRRTHLDELPQSINILRGDLSLIGPRPEQPHYVQVLSKSIPYYMTRHLVTPGLTGWAQVNYPYGSDELDAIEKLQFELWYLKHQSTYLDLKIIVRTLRHVVNLNGR